MDLLIKYCINDDVKMLEQTNIKCDIMTLLFCCCKHDSILCFKYLMSFDIKIYKIYYNIGYYNSYKCYKHLININQSSACEIEYLYKGAIWGDNITFIKFLYNSGVKFPKYMLVYASKYGNLDVIKYLIANGAELHRWACSSAAIYGYFDVVEYLIDNNCPVDEYCAFNLKYFKTKKMDMQLLHMENNFIDTCKNIIATF